MAAGHPQVAGGSCQPRPESLELLSIHLSGRSTNALESMYKLLGFNAEPYGARARICALETPVV